MADAQSIEGLASFRRADTWSLPQQSGSMSSAGASVVDLLRESFRAFYSASVFQEHPSWIPAATGEAHPTESEFTASRSRIETKLRDLFVETPIEAGHSHPGEAFLASLIERYYADVSTWLQSSLEAWPASFSAALIEALSRIDRDDARQLTLTSAKLALRADSIEVRDAAARALEQVGGSTARRLLSEHSEKEQWLADYIRDVIEDLDDDGR